MHDVYEYLVLLLRSNYGIIITPYLYYVRGTRYEVHSTSYIVLMYMYYVPRTSYFVYMYICTCTSMERHGTSKVRGMLYAHLMYDLSEVYFIHRYMYIHVQMYYVPVHEVLYTLRTYVYFLQRSPRGPPPCGPV